MKKLLLTTISLAAAITFAHGQGTVLFQNVTPVNAPVYDEGGVRPGTDGRLAGSAFRAQLWAGPAGGQLQAIGATANFLTGSPGAGFFIGGSRAITTVAGGGVASIQVRAWRVTDGPSTANTWDEAVARGRGLGQSTIFTVTTGNPGGDPPTTPVQLTGLTSFNLVPEPSTIALGIIGGLGTLMLIRRRK
jgi:hypothetical protein